MENNAFWLILTIALPIFGSFLIPIAVSRKKAKFLALFLSGATLFSVIKLILAVANGETIIYDLVMPMGFNLTLEADYLSTFMAFVLSSISLVIVFYSLGYITDSKYHTEYYVMVILFLSAMMGLVFSVNLIWMFIFWEITAVCSWRLAGYSRSKSNIIKANKTFMLTAFGALCLLLGIIVIYTTKGTVDLRALKGENIPDIAFFLILLGIFSKSATLPFSTWLTDAASSPVTVMLHAAILVKIAVYAYARIFCATFHADPSLNFIVLIIAGLSMLISAGAALIDTDIKRIIAYSTISQVGFIFLGLAANNKIGIAGGLLYILMHGAANAGLFLCAGIIERKTHTKDITKMGGLFRIAPITGTAFAFCIFSIIGLPPFGLFFAKFMVFSGAAGFGNPLIIIIFLIGAVLTMIYLLRLFYAVFLGHEQHIMDNSQREAAPQMVLSVAMLGLASLLLGIFIYYPAYYVDVLCSQIGVLIP